MQKDSQAIVLIALMSESETLLSTICMFNQCHVDAFGNVDRDPSSGCDRISLASHRQCPPKVLEQPQDVVAGDGWLPFRMYYGSEFVSGQMDQWAYSNGVKIEFSGSGKPTDTAVIESFNGRFREECLNTHWFESLDDASAKIDAWKWDYNEHRPHRSLEGLTPREFARRAMFTGAAD